MSQANTSTAPPPNVNGQLTEEQVIMGFHLFLRFALTQAKAERLIDADTLATYFRTLDFSLGERQIAGVIEFSRRAAAAGALDAPVVPEFAEI